jgi:hypothetical protein
MFGLTPDEQILVFTHVLAILAGATAAIAAVCHHISRKETQAIATAKHRASPKMETGVDLQYIDEALSIANS